MQVSYPAGGWLPVGAYFDWQHSDQGRDFVTNWRGVIQAPGSGECLRVGSDRSFPGGFGPAYPYVRIDTGHFAGHTFYIGHTTSLVSAGQKFGFGTPLSHADQGLNFNGTIGGWVELGEAFGLMPGPNEPSHWFDHYLTSLVVSLPDPAMKYGDKGWNVFAMSRLLVTCGWLPRPYYHFRAQLHGAVVAFQNHHRLKADGVVGPLTHLTLEHAADWCRRHHRREV